MANALMAKATQVEVMTDGELMEVFIGTWCPLIIIVPLLIWFLWSTMRTSKKIRERSFQHMDRLEAKTDEMIALLKEINSHNRSDGDEEK